jgi:hypothetical protein
MKTPAPVATPVADPSQPTCVGSRVSYSNPSHPRVGLHLSQTRRTCAPERVTEAPDADPAARWRGKPDARRAAWAAWVASGAPVSEIPAGLVSFAADACRNRGRSKW